MRTLLALLLAIPVAWGVPAPADALSCRSPELVAANAATLYSGRIVDSDRRRILVEVDEVWRGDDVVRRQWLRVDMTMWTPWGDGNQRLREHVTVADPWVFAPRNRIVNPCTMWPATAEGLERFRPTQPAQPAVDTTSGSMRESDDEAEAQGGSDLPILPIAGGGIVLVLGLAAWRARTRGQRVSG